MSRVATRSGAAFFQLRFVDLSYVEKDEKRCPHLPPAGEDEQMLDFRDQILATPKDIEDLAESGRTAKVCPYFGSRRAIPQAEVRFQLTIS